MKARFIIGIGLLIIATVLFILDLPRESIVPPILLMILGIVFVATSREKPLFG
jgi:hypothetical protein